MELDRLAETLKLNALFNNLDVSKLKLLSFASQLLTFDDQETVFEAGDPPDSAYLIVSGAADVYIIDNDRRTKVSQLGANELFGEMAFFLKTGRSATIVANDTLVVMKLEGEMFLKMVTEDPDAAFGVMAALSEKIAGTSKQIVLSS